MNIIESYILLGGAEFLRHHAVDVVKILDSVVGNVNEKGMMCTLPVVDTLIQVQIYLNSLDFLAGNYCEPSVLCPSLEVTCAAEG